MTLQSMPLQAVSHRGPC